MTDTRKFLKIMVSVVEPDIVIDQKESRKPRGSFFAVNIPGRLREGVRIVAEQ